MPFILLGTVAPFILLGALAVALNNRHEARQQQTRCPICIYEDAHQHGAIAIMRREVMHLCPRHQLQQSEVA